MRRPTDGCSSSDPGVGKLQEGVRMVVTEPKLLQEEDQTRSVVRSFALHPCSYNTAKNLCRIQLSDLAILRFLNIIIF